VNCFSDISNLGCGTLIVNVLDANCVFNGKEISSLTIAGELESWSKVDLANNNIPIAEIGLAVVRAKLDLKTVNKNNRVTTTQFFSADGSQLASRKIIQCNIDCECSISTSAAEYVDRFVHVEEWPEGFPA
jgi:hypothetical protein